MTAMQSAALEGIFRHRAVAVTGPAGSGKTILAMRRLVAFREAGMNAVYVCFNKRLAEYLGEANPSLKDCIWSVDSLFVRVADRRPKQSTQDLGEFFQEVLPGHVVDVAAYWEDARKYDAIVVDEGQDFGSSRLIALHQLLKDDGRYVYFADGRQDLYAGGSRADLGVEVAFRLVHNCRNTRRIVELANHVSSDSVPHMPGAPDGDSPVVSRCANTREMAKVAWQIAARWIGRPCRVAILSPYTLERSCMAIAQEGFNLNLARELGQWTDRQPVLFSTIRSFKGLEADAVVLVDIDELAQKARTHEEARAELYVAVTRGRTSVAMLCLDEATKASLALEI